MKTQHYRSHCTVTTHGLLQWSGRTLIELSCKRTRSKRRREQRLSSLCCKSKSADLTSLLFQGRIRTLACAFVCRKDFPIPPRLKFPQFKGHIVMQKLESISPCKPPRLMSNHYGDSSDPSYIARRPQSQSQSARAHRHTLLFILLGLFACTTLVLI